MFTFEKIKINIMNEDFIKMVLGCELTKNELQNILIHFRVCNKLKEVTIKSNFKEIMYKENEGEYNESDNLFFEKYSNKKCLVFKYSNSCKERDWFILEDNNYPITEECF